MKSRRFLPSPYLTPSDSAQRIFDGKCTLHTTDAYATTGAATVYEAAVENANKVLLNEETDPPQKMKKIYPPDRPRQILLKKMLKSCSKISPKVAENRKSCVQNFYSCLLKSKSSKPALFRYSN